MGTRGDDLFDEAALRRVLRFEADERAPRFDPAALVEAARPPLSPAMLLGGALVLVAVALTATAVWTAILSNVTGIADGAAGLVLDALAGAASLLYRVVEAAADPAVPLSLVAGLAIATYYEMSARREHAHVQAS